MEHPDHCDHLPNFLAVDRALEITGAWDVFHKLKWEYAQFREFSEVNHSLNSEDRVSLRRPMYAAINTAATAWSLVEWIWREAQTDPRVLRRLVEEVGEEAATMPRMLKEWARKNDDLEACHQIAHQAKHGDLRKPNDKFSTSVNMWFVRGPDERSGWRQTGYVVWQTEDGRRESSINSIFARVLQHWDRMLDQLHIVERVISIATVD